MKSKKIILVRIKSAVFSSYWYADKIGEEFLCEYYPHNPEMGLKVIGANGWILDEDLEVLSEFSVDPEGIKKYYILITIEELLSNGGYLRKGTEIFSMDSIDGKAWPLGTYLGWDANQNCPLIENPGYKSLPVSLLNKVKIEVTPDWNRDAKV